jgi:tRNA A37 threonylcarbamoyladenosine biosynthesis protein TsaE
VIEWPEIAQDFLPYQSLQLRFGFEGEKRYVEITPEKKLAKFFE